MASDDDHETSGADQSVALTEPLETTDAQKIAFEVALQSLWRVATALFSDPYAEERAAIDPHYTQRLLRMLVQLFVLDVSRSLTDIPDGN